MQRLRTRLRASASTGAPPSLSLDFLGLNQTLDSRVTFSRGSAATLTDSTGKLTYAPNNLVTFSEQFDNAAWTKTYSSVVANVATAPDGTSTADKLVEDTTSNGHNILAPGAVVVGNTYVHSVYLKAAGRNIVEFYGSGFAAQGFFAKFNLSNGTMFTNTGSRGAIQSVGNGWYRCSIWLVASGTSALTIALCDGSGNNVYIGDGTSGVFMWGAQLEQVTYQTTPGTYVATTSSAYYGPRFDYDPVTLNPKGLLIEEQRTNLLTYSEQFDNAAWGAIGGTISANSTTSPDGTVDADSFVESAGSTDPRLPRGVTLVIGTTYALSVYAKIIPGSAQRYLMLVFNAGFSTPPGVNFDLVTGTVGTTNGGATGTITAVGNGWYRCSIVTPAATATSASFRCRIASVDTSANIAGPMPYTGDGASGYYLYGAQLEAGAFATSYIPTVASTVTRSADVATMTGTNFSSWYNQSEGTMVADWTCPTAGSLSNNLGAFSVSDGTANERIQVRRLATTSTASFIVVDGGVIQYNEFTVTSASGAFKAALAYRLNEFQSCANGTLGSVDTSGTLPTPTQAEIGFGQGLTYLNGHIRRLAYYPTRLADYQLQGLTA